MSESNNARDGEDESDDDVSDDEDGAGQGNGVAAKRPRKMMINAAENIAKFAVARFHMFESRRPWNMDIAEVPSEMLEYGISNDDLDFSVFGTSQSGTQR